jgi:hypothetical protein
VFDDPIIGRVESVRDDFERDPRFIRHSHPGVRHHGDLQAASPRDAVHLLFDRARIAIDEDVQQIEILTNGRSGSGGH